MCNRKKFSVTIHPHNTKHGSTARRPGKIREATRRHLRAARGELQKIGSILLRHAGNAFPEPANLRRRCGVTLVLSVDTEIFDIDVGHAADQELEFLLCEGGDEVAGDDFVESG